MPIRRKFRARKRVHGRKLNKRQKIQVKRILKVRQELKYLDIPTYQYPVNSTGITFSLTDVPQGDTDSSRDGDRLFAKKMYVRGVLRVSDPSNLLRLIFYQWKPNSTPTVANILATGASGSVDVHSHYVHDNRQMYKILWDKTFFLVGDALTPETPNTTVTHKRFQLILNRGLIRQMQFAAAGTTGTNKIYYLAISDSSVIAHPDITMETRFMFTDS